MLGWLILQIREADIHRPQISSDGLEGHHYQRKVSLDAGEVRLSYLEFWWKLPMDDKGAYLMSKDELSALKVQESQLWTMKDCPSCSSLI